MEFSALEIEPSVSFVGANIQYVAFSSESSLFAASTSEPQNYLMSYDLITSDSTDFDHQIINNSNSKQLSLANRCSSEFKVSGEATKLCSDVISQLGFCSTSVGDIVYVNKALEAINEVQEVTYKWENIHGSHASCNTFDQKFTNVVSFGENGTIVVVHTDDYSKVQRVNNNSGSVPFCSKFLSVNCIVTGDLLGQNVVFDLRQENPPLKFASRHHSTKPRHFGKNLVSGVTCQDVKPDQNDVIGCGMESGEVFIWDLRNISSPVAYFEGHQSSIWDVKFHPSNSSLLYSASETGELWQWSSLQNSMGVDLMSKSQSNLSTAPANQSAVFGPSNHNIWNSTKNEICVDSLLPENNIFGVLSLSVHNSTLVCAVRNQSVFVFSGLPF